MGRDLRLYPESASKNELVSYIKSFGNVQRTTHLWDWPKGSTHFLWFDDTDYISTTGVEVTIFPVQGEDRQYTGNGWALHVRNTYSANWHDVHMLNTILRLGRKKFGGDIYGDYGKNRYAPLWKDDSTPLGRGLMGIHAMAHNNIQAVTSYKLPDELDVTKADTQLKKVISTFDPARVIYNGLVPFLVSVLEFYLKNTFVIALKYDSNADTKIKQHVQKVSFVDLVNKKEPEELIADNFTFQNMRQVKKAFSEWLDIDIEKVLRQSKTKNLWEDLCDFIQYRHEIIHHMGVDTDLSRKEFLRYAQLVELTLDVLLNDFSQRYNIDTEFDIS